MILSAGMPSLAGRRTLDVGSGVGGTVIGCARFGAAAVGIEPDAERRALALANAKDHNFDVRFEPGDLLDTGLSERIGQFDVVTALKIVEHVDDARAAVRALSSLTKDGGVALVDIPNGRSVEAVKADGHYLLPGLSLIEDRAVAASYHGTAGVAGDYDVTDYHDIDAYLDWFAQAGFDSVEVHHIDTADSDSLDATLEEARRAVGGAIESVGRDGEIGRALSSALAEYLEQLDAHRSDDAWLERHVLTNTWRVVARKGRVRRRSNRRLESWARRVAKRIPGLQAWVRRVRGR